MRRIRRGWVMKETTRITPRQRGLGGLAADPCLTPRHVGVRAVVVDEVAAGIGDVGEHAGHEVQCIDGLYGLLVSHLRDLEAPPQRA